MKTAGSIAGHPNGASSRCTRWAGGIADPLLAALSRFIDAVNPWLRLQDAGRRTWTATGA